MNFLNVRILILIWFHKYLAVQYTVYSTFQSMVFLLCDKVVIAYHPCAALINGSMYTRNLLHLLAGSLFPVLKYVLKHLKP